MSFGVLPHECTIWDYPSVGHVANPELVEMDFVVLHCRLEALFT